MDALSPQHADGGRSPKQFMLPILRGDPEIITRRVPIMMLPAIIACFVSAQFGGFGIFTFVHLFAFSVLAASMSEYKSDKGLWMLAFLFAAIWSGIIAMWMYGLRGGPSGRPSLFVLVVIR